MLVESIQVVGVISASDVSPLLSVLKVLGFLALYSYHYNVPQSPVLNLLIRLNVLRRFPPWMTSTASQSVLRLIFSFSEIRTKKLLPVLAATALGIFTIGRYSGFSLPVTLPN